MIQIDDKIISLELFKNYFVCDLPNCFGNCCIYGDAGAPLEDFETILLEKEIRKIIKCLDKKGAETIKSKGAWVEDDEGEKVTPLIEENECAYCVFRKGIARCGIEIAYLDKATDFRKPISCHLYPLRVSKTGEYTVLNFHRWHICNPAVELGKKKKVPVFRFLKEPIVRMWGELFYKEMEHAYKDIGTDSVEP